MTEIICLANSWKHGDRCIAGIDRATGNWIRPISDLDDGRIPNTMRLINGKEPALLNILDIPLTDAGSNFDFQGENRLVLPGVWKKIGEAKPIDLLKYCTCDRHILHNNKKFVLVSELQNKPFAERKTLQLICATNLSFTHTPRSSGGVKWKATLITITGQHLTEATITDPIFTAKLDWGYLPDRPCLVTVSLSMPLRPSDWEEEDEPCWKIIPGIIEFSTFDAILVEMQRLNWTIEEGQEYLQKTYGKRSRQQLTDRELVEFFNYLQSYPVE
jgi:hypothetical protein